MMSTIYFVMYNGCDESSRSGCPPRLAAAGEVLLRAAGAPPLVRRGIRSVAHPVPCAAPHRAGPAVADEPPCRHAVVRRVERDGTGRSARVARAGPAPGVAARPPRE